jgi:hypothetical protein
LPFTHKENISIPSSQKRKTAYKISIEIVLFLKANIFYSLPRNAILKDVFITFSENKSYFKAN